MNISIRLENEKDFEHVENMTREAFWDVYNPGCVEHLLVHKIRTTKAFIKELDFVACDEDIVVGNIIYTKARVINEEGHEFEVLCMGPIGVLPHYQYNGIGSLLIKHSTKVCRKLGYNGVVIFGDPKYYHRFGFKNAEQYGISTSCGDNFEEFMALELYEGSLKGISGKYYEDPVFKINQEELDNFEKKFPYKEKNFCRK